MSQQCYNGCALHKDWCWSLHSAMSYILYSMLRRAVTLALLINVKVYSTLLYVVDSKISQNSQELLLRVNKCTLTSFVALGMRREGNAPKNWEPTVGFSFTTLLQHTGCFWSRISEQRTIEHPPYSHNLALVDFYLFPRLKSALKGRRFCDATDIIKNATDELKKVSTKWLPRMFPTTLQSLADVYSCTWKYF
jgi:hypothetical protein